MAVYDPGVFGGRARLSGIVEAMAECGDCDWKTEGRNAGGLAAQHCDRTGHVVSWHQIIVTTYGPNGTPAEDLTLARPGRVTHPVDLPEGYRAWTTRPLRRTPDRVYRVATMGDPARGLPAGSRPPEGASVETLKQLATDAILYGDAWVDLAGERVDPREVVIEGPGG